MLLQFQSLSRDSGRLNRRGAGRYLLAGSTVSIPQSGFGAFERQSFVVPQLLLFFVSIPQSGFGAFELSSGIIPPGGVYSVSIPQSGFGAFERSCPAVRARATR